MAKVGDKYILHSINGMDYDIEIINVNYFRPPDEVYGADIYDGNGTYAGDVTFFGDEFLSKCEKVELYMDNKLLEKRVLFESLSQIMENQKKIMRHLGITRGNSDWGWDDDSTRELITQCDGIANEIRCKEYKEKDYSCYY